MGKERQLITEVNVGKYKFDIKVTRQIVYEAFKKHEELWDVMMKMSGSDIVDGKVGKLDDFMNVLDTNDVITEDKPKFIRCILPKMIEEAGAAVNSDEFLDYCEENDVIDVVENEIFNFAMMGFTGGRSVQAANKPKVKVNFSMR